MFPFSSNFRTALSAIEIDARQRDYAMEAHTEIRRLLESDDVLCRWGVDTVLIGSYARHTGIFPGKDVDVFTKLAKLKAVDVEPLKIYNEVLRVLENEYGDRVEAQPRSVKVKFDRPGHQFSVDAVPAVRYRDRWGIPRRDRDAWSERHIDKRWVETDPEVLTELTQKQNRRPVVDGQGAYVPTVKLIRQARKHHRDKAKPGGFYFELITFWAFERGEVTGTTFAEIVASTLASIRDQLASGAPVIDPVLDRPYEPAPDHADLASAASAFRNLAHQAAQALQGDKCPAGATWRRILGQNDKGWCFPLPEGCDAEGGVLPVVTPGTSRPSREPGAFA